MKIFFEKGLLGLEEYKNYEIEEIEGNDTFKVLRSLEDKDLSLVIVSPFDVKEDYEIYLPDETVKNLKITDDKDVELYTTVTLNSDMKKTTTNLRAPLVINIKNALGEQIILKNENYKIKHAIA
jgi:flagellar assembly factor FliW